jgi:tetratricopeptide (TPR) repeat protein
MTEQNELSESSEIFLKQAKILYGEGKGLNEVEEYDLSLIKLKDSLEILKSNDLLANKLTNQIISIITKTYFAQANKAEDRLECLMNNREEMLSIYPLDHKPAIDGIARTTNKIAMQHFKLDNPTLALKYILESFIVFKEAYKETMIKQSFYSELTQNLQTIGLYLESEAEKYSNEEEYTKSIELFEQLLEMIHLTFPESTAVIEKYTESIGTAYAKSNQCEKAKEYLMLSLENSRPDIVATLNSCQKNDNIDLKELFLTQIIPQCKLLGDYATIDDCYNQIMEA